MTNAQRYSLSAAVFTALTDVELEIDGLMSYDRAIIKMGAQPLHQIHSQLVEASKPLNQGPVGELPPCSCPAAHLHAACKLAFTWSQPIRAAIWPLPVLLFPKWLYRK